MNPFQRTRAICQSFAGFATLFAAVALFSGSSFAQAPTEKFDAANKLYAQGKYLEATAVYEEILKSGQVSPALYFNLGNACFKAGHIGRAISAYRHAKALAPRDPDIIANLQFARNQVQPPTLSVRGVGRWFGKLALNEWTLLTCGIIWVLLITLILPQWRLALRPALRGWSMALSVAAVVACACLGFDYYRTHVQRTAVVISGTAVLRQAPVLESSGPTTLHDGAELSVLDHKDDWLQVTTDARRIGWIRRDEVALNQGE